MIKYIEKLLYTVTYISTFSDTCAGQNRKKIIVAALLYAVQKFENIKTVDLKYMESGHSYLEADFMHSAIGSANCNQSIYAIKEWEIFSKAAGESLDIMLLQFLSLAISAILRVWLSKP